MKKIQIEIQYEAPNKWSAWANLGSEDEPEPYAAFADSLAELRDLVSEFSAGALYSSRYSFVETLSPSALEALEKR